jgi:hypothetical protein
MTAPVTHYVPEPNGPTRDQRVSVCGVRTRAGGPREFDTEAAFGSSNPLHVNCRKCLATSTRFAGAVTGRSRSDRPNYSNRPQAEKDLKCPP